MAKKPAPQYRDVLEYAAGTKPHMVDREAGVIRRVKILGSKSKNGGTYPKAAMEAAMPLYEGASVFLNHPKRTQPDDERGLDDQTGWLENVSVQEGEMFGDYHYIKSHPRAEQIAELAERKPTKFGLSHNARVSESMRGGELVYESINRVRSVDLVCNPATTRGIFESELPMEDGLPVATEVTPVGSSDMTLDMFISKASEIFSGEGEAGDKVKKINALAKALLKVADDVAAATADKPAETRTPAGDVTESTRVMEAVKVLGDAKVEITPIRIEAVAAMKTIAKMKDVAESYKGTAATPAQVTKPRSTPAAATAGADVLESQKQPGKWDDPKAAATQLLRR